MSNDVAAQPLVSSSLDGAVATLTLNRPDKLNALTPPMFVELRHQLARLAELDTLGCLIIQGAGRSFCAGHDLAAIKMRDGDADERDAAETIDLLEQFPQPTIAKITGHCLTGGLELALGCDLLICTHESKFADTHGKWGLVPVWGMSVRLPERIGLAAAKELSLTGRTIDGDEAMRIGLVNRSVAATELDAHIAEMAAAICANSRQSNRIYKKLYREIGHDDRRRHLEHERSRPHGMPTDMAERMRISTS